MKKLLLIPALLAGTLALAEQKKYEISPMIGYNLAEGNFDLKDDGYLTGGIEVQFNTPDSKLSPEFSYLHSEATDYASTSSRAGTKTHIMRGAFNGVYTFDELGYVVPFVKAGAGVELANNQSYSIKDGFFLDAGAGMKVPFNDYIALKFEAIYMAKLGGNNEGFADNNLVAMAGLTFSFGNNQPKSAPKPAPVVAVVDGDDDNDGILNSKDSCISTPAGVKVDALGCALVTDADGDGVADSADKCPLTPNGTNVDAKGCKVDLDLDKDGVLNSADLCPNTIFGDAVNSDGCPQEITLKINFENNSADIKESSNEAINAFATFLSSHTNYNANIVGYTDSRGSAAYNKKLSLNRANQVKAILVEKGVNASQIKAIGMGEMNPIADNETAEGRLENRRIQAELIRN